MHIGIATTASTVAVHLLSATMVSTQVGVEFLCEALEKERRGSSAILAIGCGLDLWHC